MNSFKDRLTGISGEKDFSELALQTFERQFELNQVYRDWCASLNVDKASVHQVEDIPFLPITFFKTHDVICEGEEAVKVFKSSGTGGNRSSHALSTEATRIYDHVNTLGFEHFFGPLKDRPILALLPHYLENGDSSLVDMCRNWMAISGHPSCGFYLDQTEQLVENLQSLSGNSLPPVLIGASYALLDLAEESSLDLKDTIIIETGGMKGRKKEMVRQELHSHIIKGFSVERVYSEYGMTELLSQAYLLDNDSFQCPPWMQLRLRDARNPLDKTNSVTKGCVNIIDLANQYSCSFIATDDLGRRSSNGIQILGRLDTADVRGCNLLVV